MADGRPPCGAVGGARCEGVDAGVSAGMGQRSQKKRDWEVRAL